MILEEQPYRFERNDGEVTIGTEMSINQQPKQETLEEAAEKMYKQSYDKFGQPTWDEGKLFHRKAGFIDGANWQKERMYSEEEVETIAKDAYTMGRNNLLIGVFNKWFEQFKKK
jgi:hypothetical protein